MVEEFPVIMQCIDDPQTINAFFSVLDADLHRGYSKAALRYHLGITILQVCGEDGVSICCMRKPDV
jgi:PII-like signaling protein